MYTRESVKEFCRRATDEYLIKTIAIHAHYIETLESHIANYPVSDRLMADLENIRMTLELERKELEQRSTYVYHVMIVGMPFLKFYRDILLVPIERVSDTAYILRTNKPSDMEYRLNTDASVESYTVTYPKKGA